MSLARLASILLADGPDFVSRPIDAATLTLGGLAGDAHAGPTRRACARVPWHPRGAVIANTRQVSLVSVEELRELALLLDLRELPPGLLGASLETQGLPALSALPPATRLRFPSGATVFVTEENQPCGKPGRALARAFDRPDLARAFKRLAIGRRGLLGIIERAGAIAAGDPIEVITVEARRAAAPLPTRLGARTGTPA